MRESADNTDFALARYNSDGTLDASSAATARSRPTSGVGYDHAYAVAIQSDGKIVAAGCGTDWLPLRLRPGALQRRWLAGHLLRQRRQGHDRPSGRWFLCLRRGHPERRQDRGRRIWVGDSNIPASPWRATTAMARWTLSFGSGGLVTTPMGAWFTRAYALAIQSDGKIVAAGRAYIGGRIRFRPGALHQRWLAGHLLRRRR